MARPRAGEAVREMAARTRIDCYGTPLEEADRFGPTIGAPALRSVSLS